MSSILRASMTTPFSTDHIDYLQRSNFDPELPAPTANDLSVNGRLWHVRGIGRLEKEPASKGGWPHRLPTEELAIGLYGSKTPLAFLLRSTEIGIAIHIGTWVNAEKAPESEATLKNQLDLARTALSALYPYVDAEDARSQVVLPDVCGFALGIPSLAVADAADGSLPLDRLIRALPSENWAALVLAEPWDEERTANQRDAIINEMRAVQQAQQAEQLRTNPLAEHYLALLKSALESYVSGLTIGMWRTAVYLLGDTATFPRLASLWRGIFSGRDSAPEPVRVWKRQAARELAARWIMPTTPGAPPKGGYRHPYECQTLLTSSQLAAYVHFPIMETNGFAVRMVPEFDAEPPSVGGPHAISVGRVVVRTQMVDTEYAVDLAKLTKHTLVVGTTGSGKTNAVFHLLKQAAAFKVPFLVIEPAKAEYRALLKDANLGDLRVFTLGNELIAPFRLNPFEVASWPTIP